MIEDLLPDPPLARQLIEHVGSYKYNFRNEDELQEGVFVALQQLNVLVEREKVLSDQDRLDFFVDGRIAVECKIDGGLTALTRQLYRYAMLDEVQAIVLVTNLSRLTNLPSGLNKKPLYVVRLLGAF